jgi:pimeloyl-ACP methyl ester carboxylesterase
MANLHFLSIDQSSHIAYRRLTGKTPGVVFLCGHGSDMDGSKALEIEVWARNNGRSFLRFDYQGHGQSSGNFLDGNISSWTNDCLTVLDQLTDGPQILVGSSLGGWLMLNVALARPERICALVGIAAAPDFTEDLLWTEFDAAQRRAIEADGKIALPNPYSDEPVVYPWHLITDGRQKLRLTGALEINIPVRLLHGMADHEVPWQTATRIAECLTSSDVEIMLIKDAGHRFSEPGQLALLTDTLDALITKLALAGES